jgi:hypothetical protein
LETHTQNKEKRKIIIIIKKSIFETPIIPKTANAMLVTYKLGQTHQDPNNLPNKLDPNFEGPSANLV